MPVPSDSNSTDRQKEIFMAALELADAIERQQFLDSACGDNAELRNRIARLLQLEEQSRDFLEPPPSAETPPEFPTPQPGQSIGYFGDYILLDEIARGSSGVVFRARQSSLNRIVALKMLRDRPLLTNADEMRRFRAEAEAAAGLDHPGIVPIYEVGEHEGQGYFSMKFIEGGTLHFRAGEFREPRAAAALIAKVSRAVHHAHEHGILHRDLKPGNILINRDGEPLVVDFGIARHIGLESDLTHTGQIVGTPHYMAPEQARGANRALTAAADIYSLGAMLYELLAGRKLFDGETMLTLLRQVTEQAPAPLRIGDRDLESIVMRCLEKQPDARFGSAAALADDLERWLRGERLEMPATSWSRRRFAYAALAVLGGGGAATFFWPKKPPVPEQAGPAGKPNLPERGSYAASRKAAEWLRSVPKNATESYISLHYGTHNFPGIKDSMPLPPGDWHVNHIWLDRFGTAGFPPVDGAAFAEAMSGLTELRNVTVRQVALPEESYVFLAHNPELENLQIEGGGAGDGILNYVRELKKLRRLVLSPPKEERGLLTGRGLDQLASLPVLEDLSLVYGEVEDAMLPALRRCKYLRQIVLARAKITDEGVRSLAAIPTLSALGLDDCPKLTDETLESLAALPSLKRLSIMETPITHAGAEAFKKARPDCEFFHNAKPPPEVVQFYKIKNIISNKVLAIDDRFNAEEGAPIVQRIGGPKDRQLWRFEKDGAFYKIINGKSGMALTVQDASLEAGAKIVQSDPRGQRENQQWTVQKTEEGYVIKARHSGHVLDVENGAFEPKAPIIQYPFTEGRNQFFELKRLNDTDIPDPQ